MPQGALYVFICVSCLLFLCFFPRETPESQICIFPFQKNKNKPKKETNGCKLLPAMHPSICRPCLCQTALIGKLKHKYTKHSVAICFCLFLFCFFSVYLMFSLFLGKTADLGFRSLPSKKTKQKRKNDQKRNKYKALWSNLFLVCSFFVFPPFKFVLVSGKMKHSAS